jgi:hypothetical protein
MDINTLINIFIFIICIIIFYNNVKDYIKSDISLYNKIVKSISSSIFLIILFFILYLYRKGILGLKLLELLESSNNEFIIMLVKTTNFITIFLIIIISIILFTYSLSKNFIKFVNFIQNGKSHNLLKIVPKFYNETYYPCGYNFNYGNNDINNTNNKNDNDYIENFSNISELFTKKKKRKEKKKKKKKKEKKRLKKELKRKLSNPYLYKKNDKECPPISFYNELLDDYQNFKICDFYYNSSFNSMISTSNKLATLNIDNLKKNIYSPYFNGNGMRLIHLQVYSSGIIGDENSFPIISSDSLYQYSEPYDFNKIMEYLNDTIFKKQYSDNCILPFFLYLEFKFDENDINIYNKIASSLKNTFENKLINKKYGFNGRGGKYPLSQVPIKDAFGKISIITNRYPTYSLCDEYINLNIKDDSQCNYIEYDKEYFKFNTGLSTVQSKSSLILKSKNKLTFVVPKLDDETLFNPDIKDCFNYGIQFVLINTFYENKNYEKINKSNYDILLKFKNKWNSILLKDKSFRYIETPTLVIQKKQDYNKLNNIKTIEIIPGFAPTTQKSGFI